MPSVKRPTRIVKIGPERLAVDLDEEQFNQSVAYLATFLHGTPDRNIGGVTRSMARDALMSLTGFTEEQLGQIATAGTGVVGPARH